RLTQTGAPRLRLPFAPGSCISAHLPRSGARRCFETEFGTGPALVRAPAAWQRVWTHPFQQACRWAMLERRLECPRRTLIRILELLASRVPKWVEFVLARISFHRWVLLLSRSLRRVGLRR